jgi:integrase
MTKLRLRDPVPRPLHGSILVDRFGRPRFWATIWADLFLGGSSDGTREVYLAYVEQLYRSVAEQFGEDLLDDLIAKTDFESLEAALGAFLARLRNQSAIRSVNGNDTWSTAQQFINDILVQFSISSADRMAEIQARLLRLERLYGQISPSGPRPPVPIRALPAVVVEDLHEVFDPVSRRNPFRTTAARWRNYLIFLMCLYLGLRKGELLILPVDAVKDDFDFSLGATRFWINIVEPQYGDLDPRYSQPNIKTNASRRPLQVSEELVRLVDLYTKNYRGKCPHAFLFSSQRMQPLAISSVGKVFAAANASLTARSKKALLARGMNRVTPHSLRHTAVCVRLAKYVAGGDHLDRASEKLRVFFGWSRDSNMPLLYARAYFETRIADAWNDDFDGYVDVLRNLTGELE